MKKQEKMRLVEKKFVAKDTVEFVLQSDFVSQLVQPGQFIHIFIEGHTLRRPISIADVDVKKHTLTILFKVVGSGTKKLATYESGQVIHVLGPLGNDMQLPSDNRQTVLLIGGGIGVPPLYLLGKRLVKNGNPVIAVLGFQTGESVFYEEKFQSLGETMIVTDDGSYGKQGLVTNHLPELNTHDLYFACGPTPMLKSIQQQLIDYDGYLSLEERMGCGVGACLACVVSTNDSQGYRKICQDGPVFHAKDVTL